MMSVKERIKYVDILFKTPNIQLLDRQITGDTRIHTFRREMMRGEEYNNRRIL